MLPSQYSEIGAVKIVEVFDFFDFPRLFSCARASGQKYLALSVDDSEGVNTFLYSSVSEFRYKLLLQGGLSLREPYSNPEDGWLYKVESTQTGVEVSRSKASELPSHWLPPADAFIESELLAQSTERPSLDVSQLAVSGNREIANLALKLPRGKTDIRSRLLGQFLVAFQELVDAVGQKCAGEPTLKGAISKDILDRTQLQVLQTYPSSFGIQFAANQQSDLFQDSLLAESLSDIYHLMEAEFDEDRLSNLLHSLRGRATSKYRSLLESMIAVEGSVTLDWGSPKEGYGGQFVFSQNSILKAYEIVSSVEEQVGEEVEVVGQLVGLNVRTKTYEISSVSDKQKYAGKLAAEAPESIHHAQLSEMYVATLKRVIEVQSTSGEEKERWLLVNLREPVSNSA